MFIPHQTYAQVFGTDETQFSGYFSREERTDIDESFIATKITVDNMTKTSRQLMVSMGGMAGMIQVFGIMFLS